MSRRLKKNVPMLKILQYAKPSLVKQVLKQSDNELLSVLCECCLNVLRGNVPLSTYQKKRLKFFKKTLRAAADKKTTLARKRVLFQKGGFLRLLIPPVLSVLGSLLN